MSREVGKLHTVQKQDYGGVSVTKMGLGMSGSGDQKSKCK